MPLAAALDPERTDLNLEVLAAEHGLPPEGRHTALGDALLAAGLFVRLVPLLEERGVRTFGEARAFAATARRVAALQRAAGW
jgi:DNA polymerase-3 subunit epsilon